MNILQNLLLNIQHDKKYEQISQHVNYQTHRHAHTWKKKEKNICSFNFLLPPMSMSETELLTSLTDHEFDENTDVERN